MPNDEGTLAVSVSEGARRLGVSVRTVSTLIARGDLGSCKIGRRRVIPIAALEAFLQAHHSTGTTGTARNNAAADA